MTCNLLRKTEDCRFLGHSVCRDRKKTPHGADISARLHFQTASQIKIKYAYEVDVCSSTDPSKFKFYFLYDTLHLLQVYPTLQTTDFGI
jgi:hypothetical protein